MTLIASFSGKRIFEGLETLRQTDSSVVLDMWLRISVGAFIAFAMEVSEFLVLCSTSSLTLSVAGIFKVGLALLSNQSSPNDKIC